MKKLIAMILLALLVLGGCSNQTPAAPQSESESTQETATRAKDVAPDYTYLRSTDAKINFLYEEEEDRYGLSVEGISKEQYQEYMDKLADAGFDDIMGEEDGIIILKHKDGIYGAIVIYDGTNMQVGIAKYEDLDSLA